MRQRRSRWRYGWIGAGLVAILAISALAVFRPGLAWLRRSRNPLAHLATTRVAHTDLSVSLTTSGVVESSKQTIVECELENLEVRVRGQGMAAGGAATLLTLVPEGTTVKRGELLCQLDSSDYEELVRQQEINVERARADHRQAELDDQVAKLALQEFRDGNLAQDLKEMRANLALAESDLRRSSDRMQWTRRMRDKGYVSVGQFASDEMALTRSRLTVGRNRTSLDLYERYTAPRIIRTLENNVQTSEALLRYQDARLQRHELRLRNLKRQVERCTIRAPHDGFVIYANDARRGIVIEEGMTVRQKQRLFILPDLAHMEVEALLHETIVSQVREGMLARVRVESLSDRILEGHVTRVAQLATPDRFTDVRYFLAIVQLDTIPKGLRPGLSAEIEIMTERRPGALAIPPEALAIENGQEVCYVAHNEAIERRPVKVGGSNRELLEVTEGLTEGEEVVLDPENLGEDAVAALAPVAEPSSPSPTAEAAEPSDLTH